jgi:hypothetical protein
MRELVSLPTGAAARRDNDAAQAACLERGSPRQYRPHPNSAQSVPRAYGLASYRGESKMT